MAINSGIDTRLPEFPPTTNPELLRQLILIYNAIFALQLAIESERCAMLEYAATATFGQPLHIAADGKIYLANAAAGVVRAFCGMCPDLSGVATGAHNYIQSSGILRNLTGLTPGAQYYLDETAGTIATSTAGSIGALAQPVGIALSATEFLILPGVATVI